MKYSRNFVPLRENTSGFGRGGMIPHGIARMEQHEDALKIRVNIYGLSPKAGPYSVYAIGIADGTYRRNALGQLQPDPLGRCELGYRSLLRGDESYEIRALVVTLEDDTEILVGYMGNPVDWHHLRDIDAEPEEAMEPPEEENQEEEPEEPAREMMPEEEEPEEPAREIPLEEEEPEEPTREIPPEETEPEEPSREESIAVETLTDPEEMIEFSRTEDPEEEESIPVISRENAADALLYMFHSYPRIYPFRHSDKKWIRIHPRDLAPLPVDAVALENSPFLQRGYLQYKHLILGCNDTDEYYLGVPFRYHKEQEEIGHNWGFTEFVNSAGSTPSVGDYGYWIMPIHLQDWTMAV